MALTNYDELQSTVAAYAFREGDPSLPVTSLIALAESDLQPVLKHYMMEKTVTLPVVDSTVTFPADFIEPRVVAIDGVVAKPVSPYNARLYPNEVGYFMRGNAIVVVREKPNPAQAQITYFGRFKPLAGDNQVNWLLAKFPTVYLHATMIRIYRWLGNADAEKQEKQSLGEALGTVSADHNRASSANSGNTIIMDIGGQQPW